MGSRVWSFNVVTLEFRVFNAQSPVSSLKSLEIHVGVMNKHIEYEEPSLIPESARTDSRVLILGYQN